VEVDPLGYVARFLTIFFFVVVVHELSHALAHPRDVLGFYIGLDKRQGIVFAVDVKRNTTVSLLAPQLAVPVFLIICVYAGWLHWVEAAVMPLANTIPSWHDISLLVGEKHAPAKIWRIGIYREPPHLRIGWI